MEQEAQKQKRSPILDFLFPKKGDVLVDINQTFCLHYTIHA